LLPRHIGAANSSSLRACQGNAGRAMLMQLLRLPFSLLQIGFYALRGLADSLGGRKRLRVEVTTLINAPRDAVWRFMAAERTIFDGPPLMEIASEPLTDGSELWLTRVSVNGQEAGRIVSRRIERDEAKGILLSQGIPHELAHPPELANDCIFG